VLQYALAERAGDFTEAFDSTAPAPHFHPGQMNEISRSAYTLAVDVAPTAAV
jgi:hypothetical protein